MPPSTAPIPLFWNTQDSTNRNLRSVHLGPESGREVAELVWSLCAAILFHVSLQVLQKKKKKENLSYNILQSICIVVLAGVSSTGA